MSTPDQAPVISLRDAFSFTLAQFKSHPGPLIGLAAIVTILQFLSSVGSNSLANVLTACLNPQSPGQEMACDVATSEATGPLLLSLVFAFAAIIATIGIQRAALEATIGIPPSFSALFNTRDLGKYVLFAIVSALLTGLGVLLCIVPGLIVYFLLQLGPYVVLDRSANVGEAIKVSARLVRSYLNAAVALMVIYVLGLLVGSLFMGIPTLVVLPFVTLVTAHVYRQMQRHQLLQGQ